jgi:dipeptidyl aminopeptidase/acylaminoacyl peptidase
LALQYAAVGRTLLGERICDGMAVIDYLRNCGQPAEKIGVTGNSGGGTTALWLAALDERIDVCVPGSYLCSFQESIYAVPHCDCNYVPGLLNLMEMGDLAAMIAPRPFCAIHGERDPIFPVTGTRKAFATVRAAYQLLNQPDHCHLLVHGGGHAFRIGPAVDWFARYLDGKSYHS